MSGRTYWDLKGILSEIRSNYNCFDEKEEPYYRALSEAIRIVSAQPEIEERKEESAQNVPKEDLISRKAAIDAIGEKSDEIYKTKQKGATYPHNDFFQGMAYAGSVVKQLPSAQPEIIRCKDCRYWGKHGLCDKWDYYISNGDFYCGCAERRTDENNNE